MSSFDGVKPCAAGAKMHRALSSYDKTEQSVILKTGETWHLIMKELSNVFVLYVCYMFSIIPWVWYSTTDTVRCSSFG